MEGRGVTPGLTPGGGGVTPRIPYRLRGAGTGGGYSGVSDFVGERGVEGAEESDSNSNISKHFKPYFTIY
jgi:hypothetical protein